MQSEGVEQPVRFGSSGRISGVVGLGTAAMLVVWGALNENAGFAPWIYCAVVFVGVAIWTILLRPAVVLGREEVELRNVLHSRWIPLARITDVSVRQVTVVTADGERHVGIGLGRSRRQISRDARRDASSRAGEPSVGRFVEEKLRRRAADARDLLVGEPPAIRRAWAWPEIVALVVLGAATLVLAVVA